MLLAEIDELAEHVVDYHESWQPASKQTQITAYSGEGIGLRNDGQPASDHLFASLLYYPRILIHCPFGDWFTRDRSRMDIGTGHPLKRGEVWSDFGDLVPRNDYFSQPRDLKSLRDGARNKLMIINQIRELVEEGIVLPGSGADAVRASYGAMFTSHPDLRADILDRQKASGWTVDHERVSGGDDTLEVLVAYLVEDGLISRVIMLR